MSSGPVTTPSTLTVAENAATTLIGIMPPTDGSEPAANFVITIDTVPLDGSVTLPDGSVLAPGQQIGASDLSQLSFTALAGDFDDSSQLTYTVTETDTAYSAGGTVTLNIGPAVGNPVTTAATVYVPENSAGVMLNVPAPTDPNYDSSLLMVTIDSVPQTGAVTVFGSGGALSAGSVLLVSDFAQLSFTPTAGLANQSDTLTYTVSDPDSNSSDGAVTIAVGGPSGNPVVAGASLTVAENAAATSIGIPTPTDPVYPAASLQVLVTQLPADGTVTTAAGTTVTLDEQLSVADLTQLEFTPNTGMAGASSSFGYTVSDQDGFSSNGTATLAIGSPPTVASPTIDVTENSGPAPIGIAAPIDPSYSADQLTVTVLDLPGNGTLALNDGTAVSANEVLSVSQFVGLLFTPTPGVFGRTAAFDYSVSDLGGNTATGTVQLAIGPAVGNPTASSPTLDVAENAGASAIGIAAPTDPNYAPGQLTINVDTLPTDGSVTLASGAAVQVDEQLTSEDLTGLQFTPTAGLFNQGSAFTYTVSDPSGNQAVGSAQLVIGSAVHIDPMTGADLPVITPGGTGTFKITDPDVSLSGTNDGTGYTGPVSYLLQQFIWGGSEAVAVKADTPDVFLKGGSAGDALQVTGGNNVLDGGGGSNFLVGATGSDGGSDVFFADARGSETTWSTIVNFHPGDEFTLWGFVPGTSTQEWDSWSGATGYQGVSMHSETNGPGTGINASVTFAGVTQQVANSQFVTDTGTIGSTPYLHIAYTG